MNWNGHDIPDADWVSPCGNAVLYHRDCLDILPQLPDGCVALVCVDPPYGIGLKSNGQRFVRDDIEIANDSDTALMMAIYLEARRRRWPLCMFYSPYCPPQIDWRSILVWDKGGAVGAGGDRATCWKRTFELIGVRDNNALNGLRDVSVLRYVVTQRDFEFHPCQKPVDLMSHLVGKLTQPSDCVVDACMGVASTGVACARLGRKFIGIELERKYFDIAVTRIDQELRQGKLFAEAAR